jgi:sec-independent protein translocase protein TatA
MPFIGGHWWLIGLLIIVLIIFGPGKLPQIGGAVGQAINEFRRASSELKDEVSKATSAEQRGPEPPAATTTVEPADKEKAEPSKA